MRRLLLQLLFVPVMISLASCQSHEVTDGPELVKQVADSASIRVLALGNSFTDNATGYMPQILRELNLDGEVFFAKLCKANSSLENHWNNRLSGEDEYKFSFANAGDWVTIDNVSINYAFDLTEWDVVILQQVSYFAGKPETFHPWLDNLAMNIRESNPNVRLGWQMTWAYGPAARNDGFVNYGWDPVRMYDEILSAIDDAENVVDFVIPSAKVVNSLKYVIGNDRLYCDDMFHLQSGVPFFVLSCVWYNTFLACQTSQSLSDVTYRNLTSPLALTPQEYHSLIEIIEKYSR